ncbi:cytochrome c oxidase assembly protein [Microbacterium sp. GXF7504]
MPGAHDHGGDALLEAVLAGPFVVAAVAYVWAVLGTRRRGRPWPWHRTACWLLGLGAAASGFVGPLADAAHGDFVAHMGAHLLVGMLAPLLLVLAAPVTLALRALDVVPARRLSRILRSGPATFLTHPVVAAALSVGGLWLVYTTPLHGWMREDPLLHLVVMLHLLLAGLLFTAAIAPVDPSPHRASFPVRAGVFVAAVAAHGILAKSLYAAPPSGVPVADGMAGARLMFSGGDVIELALAVVLCAGWYRETGRRTVAVPTGEARA